MASRDDPSMRGRRRAGKLTNETTPLLVTTEKETANRGNRMTDGEEWHQCRWHHHHLSRADIICQTREITFPAGGRGEARRRLFSPPIQCSHRRILCFFLSLISSHFLGWSVSRSVCLSVGRSAGYQFAFCGLLKPLSKLSEKQNRNVVQCTI